MAQERFYHSSKSYVLQLVDQDVVSHTIQSYTNGESIDAIKKKLLSISLTNTLYTNLPHEITPEKCVCGYYLYEKVEGRSACVIGK